MALATQYDRAVGFFNSTIYTLAWDCLRSFVERGGHMRIICSPVLSEEDIKSIQNGYGLLAERRAGEALRTQVRQMLSDPYLQKPTRVLASLIALDVIDIRIAFMEPLGRGRRLFHDKLGLFKDSFGNIVAFKGSMNETWSGLSNDGNLESVDVFLSWESKRERQRIDTEIAYFDTLWDSEYPQVQVKKFPDVARDELVSSADTAHWIDLVSEICMEIREGVRIAVGGSPIKREPRPYQVRALTDWNSAGRRGIFEHATGSGKTFTAICAMRESFSLGETCVVVVPSELLLTQWHKEIRDTLADLKPEMLVCGGGHTQWRDDRLLGPWTRPRTEIAPRIVLSTMTTAAMPEFRAAIRQGPHLFLVADEVHRLGGPENRKIMTLDTGPRLGLSATPTRAGDPDGTEAIFSYFGGVVPPPFTLKDAIPGTLTPYFYYVHPVTLTDAEQAEWVRITKKARILSARAGNAKSQNPSASDWLKQLFIERGRILKGAVGKVQTAVEVIQQYYTPGQKWIVYCDTILQLQTVIGSLRTLGIQTGEYHSSMQGDREQTLRLFEVNGGILVSVRCLDEGVDIPSVSHALILASSKNPREFIQRRGRVLRKAPGKYVAYIHDAIVLPREAEEEDIPGLSIVEGELTRAVEFSKWAENPGVGTDLERIALSYGMNYQRLLGEGVEDDDDE
jgi:superfamily II DNA or RNA helicase